MELEPPIETSPLVEGEAGNATLRCKMVDANPANLTAVYWYQDGQLVDEGECNDEYVKIYAVDQILCGNKKW